MSPCRVRVRIRVAAILYEDSCQVSDLQLPRPCAPSAYYTSQCDMADDNASVPQPDNTCRQCGACGRVLDPGIETDSIGISAASSNASCDQCSQFDNLHAAMQEADQQWTSLMHRSTKHVGRQNALAAFSTAHIQMANFFLDVEESNHSIQEQAEDPQRNADSQQGVKRPRSSTSLSPSRSPKRSRLTPSTKVFRFDDSVVFRDDSELRDSGLYLRDTKEYVRGRNAAPEGLEWVDHSGHDQPYGRFHGLKWAGKKWIKDPNVNDVHPSQETEDDEIIERVLVESSGNEFETQSAEEIGKENEEEELNEVKSQPTLAVEQEPEDGFPMTLPIEATALEDAQAEERMSRNTALDQIEAEGNFVLPERPASS